MEMDKAPIAAGSPMFRLDSASYEAARDSAHATVARSEAALTLAAQRD